jgi:hypothetical protein
VKRITSSIGPLTSACRVEKNSGVVATADWPLATRLLQLFLGLILVAFGLFGAGCRSMDGPASASFASVTISGKSAAQICETAAAVFREEGYQAFSTGQGLVCEKEGSRANTISRDGLVAAQAGARTLVRVRTEVVDLENGFHRLQCQAYMVSGAGDSFFEEEHRLANFRSKPYQKLLDEVAKRLKAP